MRNHSTEPKWKFRVQCPENIHIDLMVLCQRAADALEAHGDDEIFELIGLLGHIKNMSTDLLKFLSTEANRVQINDRYFHRLPERGGRIPECLAANTIDYTG